MSANWIKVWPDLTVCLSGIQMVKGCDLADHSDTGHFGPITGFFSPFFTPPFKYWTIWQPDTNQLFEYQSSLVFRWLLKLFTARIIWIMDKTVKTSLFVKCLVFKAWSELIPFSKVFEWSDRKCEHSARRFLIHQSAQISHKPDPESGI